MPRTLTQEFSDRLMELMIRMDMPKEICLEVCTAIETLEELRLFLDKLAQKNYEMTPEEVNRALGETIEELQ